MSVDGSSSACCLSILGSSFDELIFCRSVAQAQDYEPDRVAAGTGNKPTNYCRRGGQQRTSLPSPKLEILKILVVGSCALRDCTACLVRNLYNAGTRVHVE